MAEPLGRDNRPGPDPTPAPSARTSMTRRGMWAAWCVAIPYAALMVCWVALAVTSGDTGYSWLMWLYGMWLACLVCVPLAGVGAALGAAEGSRVTKVWGIVAVVLCLPGFFLSFTLLGAL